MIKLRLSQIQKIKALREHIQKTTGKAPDYLY